MNFSDPVSPRFPSLPIITPDSEPPPRARSQADKYGAFFYLGIAGLAVLVSLVGWFGYRMWSLRDVWVNIYALSDTRQPEEIRLQAAIHLAGDPRVEQTQLWDMSLNRGLPDLARCVLAEGIQSDLVAADPQAFTSAVARSPDWPGWLRLVMVRPLALAATRGHALSRERLGELCRRDDPVLRLWALYSLAVQTRPDPQTVVELERVARSTEPEAGLAALFDAAVRSVEIERLRILDQATLWNHEHHPDTQGIWQGRTIRDGVIDSKGPAAP